MRKLRLLAFLSLLSVLSFSAQVGEWGYGMESGGGAPQPMTEGASQFI